MKLPTLDARASMAPLMEALFAETDRREPEPLTRRERATELGLAVLLVGACGLMAVLGHGVGSVDLGPALALTVAYAIAMRVRFHVGAAHTAPTQLVLIPLLFAVPHPVAPLFAAAAIVLSKLPDVLLRRSHPDRLLIAFVNAWNVVGAAAVFAAGGIDSPSWSDSGWYCLAIAGQVGVDFTVSFFRFWLGLGISTVPFVAQSRVYVVDVLLTPAALMVAFAAVGEPYRALLVLPLIAVIAMFAQEREAHMHSALALSNAYRGTALLLGDVLEDKDAYTASHSHGVVSLSLLVADKLKLDPAARRRVEFGALLHDIGKIAVPAEIINKPGPLDSEEWAVMKLHTVEGQHMLDRVGGVLGEVGRVVRSSHEHFNGGGYPDGLTGDGIPIEARVVCACDAFSAMTTTRSYRTAMTLEAAKVELVANAGSQFDPLVVSALLEVIAEQHISVHVPGALEELPSAPPARRASAQAP
jgi:HD-GYP domain-containing protein (c-di-GMP phosphodiesterase class II)